MTLLLQTGPALEPVSADEARTYLRLEAGSEDVLIGSLITSARLLVETRTARALINQTWRAVLDYAGQKRLVFPRAPVQEISAMTITPPAASAASTVPNTLWQIVPENGGEEVRFSSPPAAGLLSMDFVAGYGAAAADVPEPLRLAILQLTAYWFENRGENAARGHTLPASLAAVLHPYQRPHL